MASNITLRNSLAYVSALMKNQRFDVNNLEPGMTMANSVLQWMLGPPFVWRENRATTNFAITTAGGTDYVRTLPLMGRIETQWLVDSDSKIIQLSGAVALAASSTQRQPISVAPVYDDNAGNITLRFDAVPDGPYTAHIDYQKKAPLLTSYADTFAPISDEFSHIFQRGMLAEAGLLVNDSRFAIWRRDFVLAVLATQDGLDAQAKAIFLEQMMALGRTATRSNSMGQSGAQGRAQQ